jgi:K+-transporting ATPase ATPase C chain
VTSQLLVSVRALLALTVLTGLLYPLTVTAIARMAFRDQAEGSLLRRDGNVVGSSLIGQPFSGERYFWGRPSATAPVPYNAAASSGANAGPTNPALAERLRGSVEAIRAAHPTRTGPVPVDLVTMSASGLDPHVTPAAAEYQVDRVASARGLDARRVRELVTKNTEGRQLGLLGEPRVNVLRLNLDLDALASPAAS